MLRRTVRFVPVVILVVASSALCEVPATQPVVPHAFMRFVDDGQGGGSLQTADVEFRNATGASVHLVGAIHIGEKSYYDALNRDFQRYDAVLYELVKSRDVPPPSPGEAENSDNPITELQCFMKDSLDLDFQLDDIDYTAANFVHADMDKETFEKLQEERGETFEMILLRMIMKSFTDPPAVNPAAGHGTANQARAGEAVNTDGFLDLWFRRPRRKRARDRAKQGCNPGAFGFARGRKEKDRHFLWRRPYARHDKAAGGPGLPARRYALERGLGSHHPAPGTIRRGDDSAEAE
jgi:hypothetical protein